MDCSVWSPNELIKIFGRFSALDACLAPWKPAWLVWDPARVVFLSYSKSIGFQIRFRSIFGVGHLRLRVGFVSYWEKTPLYKREDHMVDWDIQHPIIFLILLLFLPSSNPMLLFITWFDDQGWRPRLAGRSKATQRCSYPYGVPPGRQLRFLY